MTDFLKRATIMGKMVDWLRDNAAAEGPPKVAPQMGEIADVANHLREEIFRLINALSKYEEGVPHPDITVDDAQFVLRWLIESKAPPNIVGRQRAVLFAVRTAAGHVLSGAEATEAAAVYHLPAPGGPRLVQVKDPTS